MLENTFRLAIALLRRALKGEYDPFFIVRLKFCIQQLENILEIVPISDDNLQAGLLSLEASFSEGGEADE